VFTLLQRMILIELFRVFFLCWIGLTGMFLLGGVIAEATQQGLGPAQILGIIPFVVPNTMPYTLPTTTLFATCVVYGRLAHDNEVLAVKAAGINLFRIAIPAIFLGAASSAGTMALYYDVIPSSHWELVGARTLLINNLEEFIYSVLRKEGRIHLPDLEYQIDVQRVEGRDLIGAVFKRKDKGSKTGGFDVIAYGPKADISVDTEKKLIQVRLWNGRIEKAGDTIVTEGWSPLPPVPIGGLEATEKARPTDMTWPEMAEFRDKCKAKIAEAQDQIVKHEAAMVAGGAPENFPDHVKNTSNQIKVFKNLLTDIAKEYQMRPALSLGCLCFVLVGCPVGIWFSRSDYLSSFITCFLPIILLYYPLMLCGINLAKSGKMQPMLAVWPANILITFTGAYLMRRLMRN
jgi:lipopolysaccharide export system permease protein